MNNIINNAITAWRLNPDLYRLDDTHLYDANGNLNSGSNWNSRHMNAFHILYLTGIDFSFVLDYVNNDELDKFKLFWTMSRDDIYDENWCTYNKYSSSNNDTVHRISCIMSSLIKLVERRKSNDSDISSTTDEGLKLEIYTQTLANNICTEFLKIMGLHCKTYPTWDHVFREYEVTILRSIKGKVNPDGIIAYRENKRNVLSLLWIETKPLEYSFTRNQNKYRDTIPQKASESLALVQSLWDETATKDYEVFGIELIHRYCAFWYVKFTHDYLLSLQTKVVLPHDQYVVMKRTEIFDLVEVNDRIQFARHFVGVINYLKHTYCP